MKRKTKKGNLMMNRLLKILMRSRILAICSYHFWLLSHAFFQFCSAYVSFKLFFLPFFQCFHNYDLIVLDLCLLLKFLWHSVFVFFAKQYFSATVFVFNKTQKSCDATKHSIEHTVSVDVLGSPYNKTEEIRINKEEVDFIHVLSAEIVLSR